MEYAEVSCCVCHQIYSEVNIPRNLNCGHSVCSPCINQLVITHQKCPECREPFTENDATELPVNYALLMVSRLLVNEDSDQERSFGLGFPLRYPIQRSIMSAGPCPVHGRVMFFMCMRCWTFVCRDCILADHPEMPIGRCFIMDIGQAVEKIKKSHSRVTNLCIKESARIREKLEILVQKLCTAQKFFKTLRPTDSIEFELDLETLISLTNTTLHHLSSMGNATEALNEKCRKLKSCLPPKEMILLEKDLITCHSSLLNLIEEENDRVSPNILRHLLGNQTDLVELVKSGKPVYAVTEEGQTIKYATVTLNNGLLHLYSLRNTKPSEMGICLPYMVIRDLVPKISPTIFLDVGYAGEIKECVYVRMFGDTPRSQQTVLLCSGEKGPSYRTTCFYESAEYENGCHILSGGDYENNDGSGGQAIVEGIISGGPYYQEVKAGLFVSWPATEHWHLGSFDIYLKDTPGLYDHSAHGQVEKGLEILQEIASMETVCMASVVDCGLVIPMQD